MLTTLVLVVHVLLTIALVVVVLLQRSEGGVLGVGGGSGGLMTARGAANLLTRATTWLAIGFVTTTIALAFLYSGERSSRSRLSDSLEKQAPSVPLATPTPLPAAPAPLPATTPGNPAPAAPQTKSEVPIAQ
jgi:preprotein translocase subunit SecG